MSVGGNLYCKMSIWKKPSIIYGGIAGYTVPMVGKFKKQYLNVGEVGKVYRKAMECLFSADPRDSDIVYGRFPIRC